jgi:hypothetical protein
MNHLDNFPESLDSEIILVNFSAPLAAFVLGSVEGAHRPFSLLKGENILCL